MHPLTFPALLSFFLPGLGQLYLRRLLAAAVLFSILFALSLFPPAWWALPVWALLAGTEVVLSARKSSPTDTLKMGTEVENSKLHRGRKLLFSAVGAVGFFAWMNLFLSKLLVLLNVEIPA